MTADPSATPELAARAWRLLFGFLMHTRPQRDAVLEELGLTPNEARSLFSLRRDATRTMSELAMAWRCDASTATWHVNRLEKLGYAERRNRPGDRRVRLVTLTDKGSEARDALLHGMFTTPPELLALPPEELETLIEALGHLPTDLQEFADEA